MILGVFWRWLYNDDLKTEKKQQICTVIGVDRDSTRRDEVMNLTDEPLINRIDADYYALDAEDNIKPLQTHFYFL